MAEKKKKVFQYVAPITEGFNNEEFATSTISLGADDVGGTDAAGEAYDGTKFTVCCVREQVENHNSIESLSEALKARWNLDLQGALDVFYSAAFTRPNYKANAKEAIEAQDWAEAHRIAQASIDDYEFNVRKAKATVSKADVAKVKGIEAKAAELGITVDELIARVMSQ